MSDPKPDPTLTYPRLLYRGPEDATAETCEVADADAAAKAFASGWRLHRTHDADRDATLKADADLRAARAKEDGERATKRAAEDAAAAEKRAKEDADRAKKVADEQAKKAKAAADEAAKHPAAPVGAGVLDGTVADVIAAVAQADKRTLQAWRAAEAKGKNRAGVLDAIDARVAALGS